MTAKAATTRVNLEPRPCNLARCAPMAQLPASCSNLRPEGLRQHVTHGQHALRGHQQAVGAAVLPEKLPTAPAGHEGLAVRADAIDSRERPAPAQVQRRHQTAPAHSATPYAAFSTLHPVYVRPSVVIPATPTGKFERGSRPAPSPRPPPDGGLPVDPGHQCPWPLR